MTNETTEISAPADRYRRGRARSAAIFALLDRDAYYSRPIALRNPVVFYEGHLPAFSVRAFLRRGLGLAPVDERLELLFERGIDPATRAEAVPRGGASTRWPSRDEVRAFAATCDEAVVRNILTMPDDDTAREGLHTALEHEAMHHETLLYMCHRVPAARKHPPRAGAWCACSPPTSRRSSHPRVVTIPAGVAVLGVARDAVEFGWDNELGAHAVEVPAFEVDALPVTNSAFLELVEAGGYSDRALWDDEAWAWIQREQITHPQFWVRDRAHAPVGWRWRAMFGDIPLPPDWPVYASHAEASAYARWKGRRLMTEAEFHRAAQGATAGHADFAGFDPVPVGTHPQTASVHGVHELVGNGWEWTSTLFAPFEGFRPMRAYPEYSADFFDGRHYVMKGASPATDTALIRPSFRNWCRATYPYVYAKLRTAR